MNNEIVNRVANSSLITLDLADYAPNVKILELDLKQFLFEGLVLKETSFRESIKNLDVSKYLNAVVGVFCSSDCIVPMWAFMLVTSSLENIASEIQSGNKTAVFQKLLLNNIENINALEFANKKVIIKGCSKIPINEAFYVAITKKLTPSVSSLMFGEACSAVPVYKKKK